MKTLYDRYMGYCRGREPLTTMAYFCWSIIKNSPIAKDFSSKVGKKINRLSSEKGGGYARNSPWKKSVCAFR